MKPTSGLEAKSAEKKNKKKKQKKTHSTAEHSKADISMPTDEEQELPKNLGTNASKEQKEQIPDDNKDPNPAKDGSSLPVVAEKISPDKVVQSIVNELNLQHHDQNLEKTLSPPKTTNE
ncbi:hypothetical protein A2U01_0049405 [Trifolium medium]|uniref:Uncharacterized protein n=1 Tax=Trifolium medium TaxID=97028 RepID=A0A392QY67_9FABA|nr:hypothetical protein [Trifolium medium]